MKNKQNKLSNRTNNIITTTATKASATSTSKPTITKAEISTTATAASLLATNNVNTNTNNRNNNANNNNNNSNTKYRSNLSYLNNINKKFSYNYQNKNKSNNNNNNNNNNTISSNSNNGFIELNNKHQPLHPQQPQKQNFKNITKNHINKKRFKMGGNARRGLEPLEFEECIVDSPEFRDNLTRHEKELDHTSHQIKRIIKQVKDLMNAAKVLSTRMKQLADSLNEFNFECIGTAQTDDEMVICDSLKHFGNIIGTIEEERDKMLTLAHKQIIEPLEDFRKKQIGGVKENKKKFDKKTEKFCQSQERFLNMSTKKPENTIQEADASLGMHEREYIQESLSYVLRIQEVQERIKFEFVEILLAFISGWLVFYHTAHEQAEDNRDYLQDLRHKVQKTRENFDEAREKVTELKIKYMEKRTKPEEKFTKRGYLFLMEKSSILKISLLEPFKATWTKYYCTYKKQKKQFTMLQFNQMSGRPESQEEKLTLVTCQRRASEFEKRFCFDLTFKEKPSIVYTFQALSEEDRRAWINAMDGTEPTYFAPGKVKGVEEYQLDETGFAFVRKCIEVLESRGLEDEGIYRKSGVGTKISKLLNLGMDRKKLETLFSDEQHRDLMESNTIASALKTFLRNLNEPLMTYRYHSEFIRAAKQDSLKQRVHEVHELVHKLPQANFEMLDMVIKHLTEVARKYEKNRMSVFNLGVVFGPTLLRPLEETVAAILDIKFNNIVINILIENYELIFKHDPNSSSSLLLNASHNVNAHSPPTRVPRSNTTLHHHPPSSGNIVVHASGRPTMYSPQQQIYRTVNKTNFAAESAMSSSLQNIPNGVMYAHVVGKGGSTGGGTGSNASSAMNGGHNMNHLNTNAGMGGSGKGIVIGGDGGGGSGGISLGSNNINMGSTKNLHSMSQSDISVIGGRRGVETTYGLLAAVGGGGTNGSGLTAHHATPANANNLRHDYLLATATPASATGGGGGGSSGGVSSSNHIYSSSNASTGNTRLNLNNVSPPTLAMRTEALYGSAAVAQQQQQRGHMTYAQAKHYSPIAAASTTSSSNESVCDSLSSSNNGGGGRVLSARTSLDYTSASSHATTQQHSSQASSISTLLGSTCDDVVTATATQAILGGSGDNDVIVTGGGDYAPKKVHRNKDVNQIKRDLSAGTARVRTLYACLGESEGELSFEPNQIITNVRFSHEPGWLQGTLNGKTGLIPENYVEHVKSYH